MTGQRSFQAHLQTTGVQVMKRSKVRSGLAAFAAGVMMMCASAPARAGIPVIDVAAIIQAVLDVMNGI